jgi:membrane-associated phospholipid phosphatase
MTNHLDSPMQRRPVPGRSIPLMLFLVTAFLTCRLACAADAGALAPATGFAAADLIARDGPEGTVATDGEQAGAEGAVAGGPEQAAGGAQAAARDESPRNGEAARDTDAVSRPSSERRLNPLRVLAYDAGTIFTAPGHWQRRQWAIFSAEVVGVAVISKSLDRSIRNKDVLAADFEPMGSWGSFGVLGLFYLDGVWRHDAKARSVAEDGLAASIIASGVITPFLKLALGRSRPSQNRGNYHFRPFSGDASFPSGHATQAFAVASVIASTYKKPWVQIVCYGAAGLVGFGRLRHNAHFASDVIVGGLIGDSIGRAVVHANRRLRGQVAVAPLIGPGARGLVLTAAF